MPLIRVREETYNRLVHLRVGMNTFDSVVTKLIDLSEIVRQSAKVKAVERTSVEADRAKGDKTT